MNINIPPDSREWLFAPRDDQHEGALWSLGRYPPPCEIGDTIIFRFDGKAVARAKVARILKPGENDTVCHNGMRYLRGYKVVWLWATFEDKRFDNDWNPDVHTWRCKMCGHLHKKKTPGVPIRSCPHCGCRFEDRRYWEEVTRP
jgi:hypothetical protein